MDVLLMTIQEISWLTVLMVFSGTLFGVMLGALPGLGSIVGISVVLPFTFSLDSASAIALLLGVYAGSIYGGSLSSILINTPGTPQSACTAFEGYPMALKGKAGEAIGWATTASVLGGCFSCLLFLIFAPQLAACSAKFGAVEISALIFLGMSSICTLSAGSKCKGIFSGLVGLMFAIVGQDPMTGEVRFTFDCYPLMSGITLIPVVVGAFAIAEVLARVDAITRTEIVNPIKCSRMILPSFGQIIRRWKTLLKSSLIGVAIGVLPGAGSTAAAFISYGEAKRSSPHKKNFGHGEPDGIIAAEASNNAVTGGALVPSMALGIPGDAVTAIMLATLILHGVVPGVRLMQESPTIVLSAFVTLCMANILLIPCGMLVMRGFSQLLRIPEQLFLPSIYLICLLGAYSSRGNMLDLYLALIAGGMGIVFRYFAVPVAPMVIGLVLGAPFEYSLRQSYIVTEGNITGSLLEHPIALFLLTLTALIQTAPWFSARIAARREANAAVKPLPHSEPGLSNKENAS